MGGKRRVVATPFGLPTAIDLMGQSWKVEYVKLIDSDFSILGNCDVTQHLIKICTDQSKGSMIRTLVHEICHAYYYILPHSLPESAEETIVQLYTAIFVDMVGNKEYFWNY